jgi:hypothetical protein
VSLGVIREAWDRFFFAGQSPAPLGLFRIGYGLMVTATLVLLRPDWLAWYGANAWVRLATMQRMEAGTRINLFALVPQSDGWIEAYFWIFLLAALLLTVGLFSRASSVAVFLCLTSIQQRNLFILHGGDTFLRVTGFFLMFAPAGAAYSVDRWLRRRQGAEGAPLRPRRPWAQRMIQMELSLLYLVSFWSKMQGKEWREGTALYYTLHVDELQHFPIPGWLLSSPPLLRIGTWAAMVAELCMGVLIWAPKLRYKVLLLGLLFHLTLDYSLNIPLFQWDILPAYLLFIDPEDLARLSERVRLRLRPAL